jgi:hypothetical protein
MELAKKARENLEAAERLLPGDDGGYDYYANASASRAYYAAYLATAHRALGLGLEFTADSGGHFRHDTLPNDAARHEILDADGADDLILLRDRRVKADYFEDDVDLDEASDSHAIAEGLLTKLLGSDE